MKKMSFLVATLALFTTVVHAQPAPSTSPATPAASSGYLPDNYLVVASPANIAPTSATQPKPDIKVNGQPRNSEGHPCTILDKQDVEEWKKRLTTDTAMQASLKQLKDDCDARIAKPLGVPVGGTNPDGTLIFPGDIAENNIKNGKTGSVNEPNATEIVKLGLAYQLTGDAKYGQYAKQMIMAYADNFPKYGHPKTWTEKNWRSQQDLRLTGQFLEDGFFLNNFAFGYDLVRDLFSADEAKQVHDDLLVPVVNIFKLFADQHSDYLDSPHNRSALCTAGTLMAGYASDDPDMVNVAMYGVGGTVENRSGGLMGVHFSDQCLLPDGLWIEGAPGYQISIVSAALFNDAETLWHHGLDMYRYRGGALKRLLDSNIILAYPDEKLTEPMLHDCGALALFDPRGWFNDEVGVPYEYGFRRYQEPNYIPIINNASKPLAPTVHSGPPTLFQDLPTVDASTRPMENANFFSAGYGLLRLATPNGPAQLLQEYGPSAGHAHPSKLGIDVFALGAPLMQFPGSVFPYGQLLDVKWFEVTLSNCVMEVDETSQTDFFSLFKLPRGTPPAEATQLVYGPASTMGMERAWSNSIYPGIVQDRSLFITPEYVADIFGTFSASPHKYDMAWHLNGDMTPSLKGDPAQFDPSIAGYNMLENVTKATSDQGWDASITTTAGKPARFVAAGAGSTDIFFATGPKNPNTPATATIIQRREGQPNAIFGNAVDISGLKDGFVKSATQEGDLDKGYALLKLDTAKGADLCFAAYKPGIYKAGGLETDGVQALVRMDGAVVKALYLGGGTKLNAPGGSIQRSDSGLAYVEKTDRGTYIVANSSSTDATVTVNLPALAQLKAHVLDENGKPGEAAELKPGADGSIAVSLKGSERVEFGP